MQKLISIIVPVYNAEKYLARCLDSIIAQTYDNLEIICINDGSVDSSYRILKNYAEKDSRIIVFNKNNTGYGSSVNIGIDMAKGEYVGIIESDDFANLEMVARLAKSAYKSGADIVKANFNTYRENDSKYEFTEILAGCPYETVFCPMEVPRIFNVTASVWSAIYKRQFLNKYNIRFLSTPGASYQDVSFAFKVFQWAGSVYCIKDAVINYRKDNLDSSVNSPKKIYCVCDEFREIEKSIMNDKENQQDKLFQIMESVKFKDYLWNFKRLHIVYKYSFLEIFYREFKEDSQIRNFEYRYWKPEYINLLQDLLNDMDAFFEERAGCIEDPRIQKLNLLNHRFEQEGFVRTLGMFDNIYIFGAGILGRKLLAYIRKLNHLFQICGFLVSSMDGNCSEIDGIRVIPLEEFDGLKKKALIVVAVKEKYQYEIVKKLSEKDYTNILLIKDVMKDVINNE